MNSPSPSQNPELWAGIATAAAAAFVFLRKIVRRKVADRQVPVTRSEFDHGIESIRNRVGAGYLALAEKLDANHKELLSAITRQGETFERRIDQLESGLARVDERTRL